MTMHTYTLPDKTISPAAIPAANGAAPERSPWTPSSWQTVGSAGGYTYSIACGDTKAYAYSSDWSRPKYQTEFRGKIRATALRVSPAGSDTPTAPDQYQQVYHPPARPATNPTSTWDTKTRLCTNQDWTGETSL